MRQPDNPSPPPIQHNPHYMRDKFPQIDEKILQRLVSATVTRRKRVLYKRHRFGGIPVNVQEPTAQPMINTTDDELPQSVPLEKPHTRTDQPGDRPQAWLTATTLAVDNFGKLSAPSATSATKTFSFSRCEEFPVPAAPLSRVRRMYKKMEQAREEEHNKIIDLLDSQDTSGPPGDIPIRSHTWKEINFGMSFSQAKL
ncbi:uncharacterized protein KD926_008327 [Aspergillus affinis]|uniref:uncharacterized protein n=1 Tax=Aspergillus affinis TaxID=1070780 RepID=UPI0022FE0CEB|nr:uncharacterized protein KD926_008327 [Aspergillus affinis]KAI9040370.1 hypothetical protein KD926_008327 [Aspergillus affinis]